MYPKKGSLNPFEKFSCLVKKVPIVALHLSFIQMWKELRIQSIINMFVNLFNLELINAKYRNYEYLAWKLNAQFYNNDLPV